MSRWGRWRLASALSGLALVGLALAGLGLLLLAQSVLGGNGKVTIRAGSGAIERKESITVDVDALNVDPPGIGSFTVEVKYDTGLVTAGVSDCDANPDGLWNGAACNGSFASGIARCAGASNKGEFGASVRLCTITFTAGQTEGSAILDVNCELLKDPSGVPITCNPANGKITIGTPPPPGSIKICKDTDPETTGVSFDFDGSLGDIDLEDGGCDTTTGLTPGEYGVTENEPSGWNLTDISCTGTAAGNIDVVLATQTVTIDLKSGASVTCTFNNVPKPTPAPGTPTATVPPGATATPTPTPAPFFKPGDVNKDGTINVFDALAILRDIVEFEDLEFPENADIDCDGDIDVFDALLILLYRSNRPFTLPPGCPEIGSQPTPTPTPTPTATPTPTP